MFECRRALQTVFCLIFVILELKLLLRDTAFCNISFAIIF